MSDNAEPQALADLRVIEWCDEKGAWAGKLLADMGATVIKVEPPGGDATRSYAPFYADEPDPDASLYFWHYNTSKRSVTLDLETTEGCRLFHRLAAGCDVVIESQPPGTARRLGIGYDDLYSEQPGLIWLSMTAFGQSGPHNHAPATDLTLLAGGGIAWMNGYDDQALPPVRGNGNQGYNTGCHYGVLCLLVALLHRDRTGEGQYIDLNMHAAVNVTTEAGSFAYLVGGHTVQRQTGRHAGTMTTPHTQYPCADGRMVNLAYATQNPRFVAIVHDWMQERRLLERFDGRDLLEAPGAREPLTREQRRGDADYRRWMAAAREGLILIAASMAAHEFFLEGQDRGLVVSIIYAPEEMLEDEHFRSREMAVPVPHPERRMDVTYVGSPYKLSKTPWRISRRPPLIGEDNADIYGELGLSSAEIRELEGKGIV